MASQIVALVGRPNVGKSTLFNRLIGEQRAIVEDIPGTTRDRLYGDGEWNNKTFTVVDTGGIEYAPQARGRMPENWAPLATASESFLSEIRTQAEVAIEESDVIVMVTDARDGLTPADNEIADVLRRTDKPVIVAVNKADNLRRADIMYEFYALGLGDPVAISALHGLGTGDLLDRITEHLHEDPPSDAAEDDDIVRIALVGRPNVGKSSLLNALLGQERSIVSDIPGTTRDAIDTYVEWEGQPIILIDTAGIRRRGKIDRGIEKYSVLRAMRAISRADVALLLIDAVEGVTAQDAHIAGYILEQMKSVIVVVNKWDLVVKDTYTMNEFTTKIRSELRFLDYVPVVFISALTRQRVANIMPIALRVQEERLARISTGALNRIMSEALTKHAPPSHAGKRLKFYYSTQVDVSPPTFVFFVNDDKLVHFSYARYIENRLRQEYTFEGTPLKLVFRNHSDS